VSKDGSLAPRRRRHRIGACAGVAVIGLLVAGNGPSTDGTQASTSTTGATSRTPPDPGSTTSTAPPTTPIPIGTYAVATTTFTAIDTSIPSTPERELPTTVWYPHGPAVPGAAGLSGGPYPLIVFSQGFAQAPTSYLDLIDAWASAGFVVAAPSYPDTDPQGDTPAGPAPSRADLVDHPADLAAVLSAVVQMSAEPGSPLSGLPDPDRVGLVGQSDGANVSLAAGADSCCRLKTVKAVVSLSGAEYTGFGGTYFSGPTPPLLVVQGSADVINPAACSAAIYDAAPTPKYYLDLLGATHLPPYETPTSPWEPIVASVTTDFLEGVLGARSSSTAAMMSTGNRTAGVATLTEGGGAPPTTTYCPPTAGGPTTGS
jgi:dienelactone hydrolase